MIPLAAALAIACVSFAIAQPPIPAPPIATAPSLPPAIYWKQHLFLIPYQWGSAAESGAAQAVTLYVSKDRGASWQKLSDAKPQVKAFNYRAEGDGEYWFAVRTLDNRGRTWPEGPFQPELRVIVDTTIPRIDELRATPAENAAVDIVCRATDVNLDAATLRIETQRDATSPWQLAALQPIGTGEFGLIQVRCQPIGGIRPATIRATISDRAGNSTVYQTPVAPAPAVAGPQLSQPALSSTTANPFDNRPALGNSTPTTNFPAAAAPPTVPPPPTTQPWPAGGIANAPFRLWTSGTAPQDDGLTAYGSPQVSAAPPHPLSQNPPTAAAPVSGDARVPAHYAGAVRTNDSPTAEGWTSSSTAGPQFATLEPYRQTASAENVLPVDPPALAPTNSAPGSPSAAITPPAPTGRAPATSNYPPGVQPKLVGSRTFALEYDLDGPGSAGVAKVELWGTRDAGKSWNRYTQDDDNRSPLIVTVDDEGLYGFKIVVHSVSGMPANVPQPGETPELWIAVDLKRPLIELTSIERGEGNLADNLILHWRAQDNNLEERPISLYFSSRASGPWSAIATNLEDTGQYAWRVERYVPSRIYLRIEARDVAGNLAAFQTREPVELASQSVNARLRDTTTQNRTPQTPSTATTPSSVGR
jgi:hypothetical protein